MISAEKMHQMTMFAVTLSKMVAASRADQPIQLTAEENRLVVDAIRLLNQKPQ